MNIHLFPKWPPFIYCFVFIILLDLSLAFDTVNYEVLLKRLHTDVGIRGKALDWLKSYLNGRSQRIAVQ